MATKEDGVFRKAYRDDAIIAICRPEKQKKYRKATETQPRTDRNLDSTLPQIARVIM